MRGQPLRLRYQSIRNVALLVLLSVHVLSAQGSFTVTGYDGEPLPFATAENSALQLTADRVGRIIVPASLYGTDTLRLSYLGYQPLEETVFDLIQSGTVQLRPSTAKAVTIIGRTDRSVNRVIGEVDIINRKNIQLSQSQTTVDALESNANVYVQRSQMGGGSPVLRGFEANRVLLVHDGVRMNNAIYRSGHLQNAITVDPHLLDQIEVIYGPGALLYGSDALGGVIHFRTKDPQLRLKKDSKPIASEVYSRYATVNEELTLHAHLDYGSRKWAGLTSVSQTSFGDMWSGKYYRYNDANTPNYGLRSLVQSAYADSPKDEIVSNNHPRQQVGTAYQQINIVQKLKYQCTETHYVLADLQFTTSNDIPRYDQLLDVDTWRRWDYGPQKRLAISLRSVLSSSNLFFDRLTTQLSQQTLTESRITSRRSSDYENSRIEYLEVYGINVDATKKVHPDILISYGAEVMVNKVDSESQSVLQPFAMTGESTRPILTRYADDQALMTAQGAYVLGEYKKEKHHLQAGLRYSHQEVNLRYADSIIVWPSDYYQGVTNATDALTGSIAHRYATGRWSISSSVGTAFRAPNVDDQAKIRIKGDEVTIPNLSLQPERSLTTEVSIGYTRADRWQAAVTGFYTRLSNAIVQAPAVLPSGANTLIQDGSTLATVANVNAAAGDIVGISVSGQYAVSSTLRLQGSVSYTRGWQYLEGIQGPLSHIPPLYGRLSINYARDQWTASAQLRFNGSKPLDQYGGSPDNIELATPIGTPAWYVIDLSAQRRLGDCWQLEVGIDNLLNRFYRPFASGVNGPGFGVIVGLRFSI